MTHALAGPQSADIIAIGAATETAAAYAAESRSRATRRSYAGHLRRFSAWCRDHGTFTVAPESVALYLASRAAAGTAVGTLGVALAAISQAALAAGLASPRQHPAVRETWRGIRRVHGTAPGRQAAPLAPPDLRRMIGAMAGRRTEFRDRALLLLGWAGALRRSELVALDADDVTEGEDGLRVTLRRSKTDQEGQGRKVGVPYGSDPGTCPVRALRSWLADSGIVAGALFRSYRGRHLTRRRLGAADVALVIQRAARRAGIDPARLSGHSLRAGLATTAARVGKPLHAIMAQTGHRSPAMVMRYIREAELFSDNAAAGIGL